MSNSIEAKEHINLKDHCTLGIGGPARVFIETKSKEEMRHALLYASEKNLPFVILGKGSNCLFDDRGYNGVVILNKIDFIQHNEDVFHVGAGFSFSRLGGLTARRGYAGLEFASGIPGSVGGAIFMNAGANGTETCKTLLDVEFMDKNGEVHIFKKDDLQFSYRTSPFQTLKGAIISAKFKCKAFKDARQKQLDIISYRTNTQPYGEKSAGCIFRNPDGSHAGALIEECSLKGLAIGKTQVSQKHANFLINTGKGTSKDFLKLINTIKENVKLKTGYLLETEVRFIPYE